MRLDPTAMFQAMVRSFGGREKQLATLIRRLIR
jgi:hypothetical protein